MQPKLLVLLFLTLLFPALQQSVEPVDFPLDMKHIKVDTSSNQFYFKVSGSESSLVGDYIRVKTLINDPSIGEEFTNFEISYSTEQEKPDRTNAKYFYSQFAGKEISLFVPKSEVKFPFYIGLHTSTNGPISELDIGIQSTTHIELDRDNDYTHIVPLGGHGQDIKFKVQRYQSDGTIEKYAAMTLSVSASIKHEQIDVKTKFYKKESDTPVDIPMYEFREGKITTFNETTYEPTDKTAYYEMTLHAEPGEIIKIDTKSTVPNNYATENEILANEEGMMGLLNNELPEECFKLNKIKFLSSFYYVNIMVYSGKARFYLIKNTSEKVNETEIYKNAAIKLTDDILENHHFCVGRPSSGQNTSYYMQVLDFSHPFKHQIIEPQDRGYIYSRLLPENGSGFFSMMNHEQTTGAYAFYMRRTKGSSIMYYVRCKDFPRCRFNSEEELKKAQTEGNIGDYEYVHSVNGYFTYRRTFTFEETTPFAKEQDVMLVICKKDECEFETAMYTNRDTVNLVQNKPFYKNFMKTYEKDYAPFFLEVENREKLNKLVVSVSLLNGDVATDIAPETEDGHFKFVKDYIYGNKRVLEYEPKNMEKWDSFEGLKFQLSAKKNAYVMVEYYEDLKNEESVKEVETGVSVIHHIYYDPTGPNERIFKINRANKKDLFVSGIYALNCRVQVTRIELQSKKETVIKPSQRFFHQDTVRTEEDLEYEIKVLEMDSSIISKDIPCQVQFSNLELMNEQYYDTDYEKEMAIPENYETQLVMNNQIERFKYMYPHTANEGPVIFTIIIETGININAYIGFGNNPPKYKYSIGSKQHIVLSEEDIKNEPICAGDDIKKPCPIYLLLNSTQKLTDLEIPIKVMVRSADESPSYVKKASVKYDYLIEGSNQYFFTDVSPGEEGEFYASFNRGSGSVYARLIPRNKLKDDDIESHKYTWHGKYFLPQNQWEGNLTYDQYDSRVKYWKEDTEDYCKPYGCYLLITLDSNYTEISAKDSKRLFPATLYFNERTKDNKTYTDAPIDEFVVGTVNAVEGDQSINNHRISFYVEMEADYIQIEFETDILTLAIKMDDIEKVVPVDPAARRVLLQFSGKDFKEDFQGSLEGHRFYVEIQAPNLKTSYIDYYVIRARTPRRGFTEIVRTDSDQKTLCNVDKDNGYCYFGINLYDKKMTDRLLLLAVSEELNDLSLFVNIVDQSIIDGNDKEKYEAALPKENAAQYDSTKNFVTSYLQVNISNNNIEERKMFYAIVGVKASKKGTVSLLNNYYKYVGDHIPNPKSPEIIHLKADENINLAIPSEGNYMVHLRSITGEAELAYQESAEAERKSYLLSGFDDNLNLAMQFKTDLEVKPLEGEFAFYITYEPRKVDENFDEVPYGSRSRIDIDSELPNEFPLYFYSKIPEDKFNTPVTFTCTFYNLVEDQPQNEAPIAIDEKYKVEGLIVNEQAVITKKKDSQYEFDFKVGEVGTLDTTLGTGLVHFSASDIGRIGDPVRYAVIKISKVGGKKAYTAISAHVTVLPLSKDSNRAPYGNHVFGQIENVDDVLSYTLTPSKQGVEYYIIEVGRNGKNTDFAISQEGSGDIKQNLTDLQMEEYAGKQIFTVRNSKNLVFTAWLKDPKKLIKNTLNFVFKYRTSKDGKIDKFKLPNENMTFTNDGDKKFSLEFYQVHRYSDGAEPIEMPAEYTVRFIKKKNFDNDTYLRTITFQNGDFQNEFYYQTNAMTVDEKLKLDIDFEVEGDTEYVVNVYSIVRDGFNWEFLTYENVEFTSQKKEKKDDDDKKKGLPFWVFIIIGVAVILLVVLIVLLIRHLRKKKKDLEESVNKVSFVVGNKEGETEDSINEGLTKSG